MITRRPKRGDRIEYTAKDGCKPQYSTVTHVDDNIAYGIYDDGTLSSFIWIFGSGQYNNLHTIIESNYTRPVKFTETNRYGCGNPKNDDVYTIAEFKECVRTQAFIDYDGFGYPVRNSKADESITIYPSEIHKIPKDATHIVWYNR